jgi:dihydrolipoamide dehydrogenase
MAVIGGGPGGYVAALRARQLGLSVVLAERERVGGCCLNRGCIPTKALLADVEGLLWVRRAVRDGILDQAPAVDFPALMRRKDGVVDKIATNLEKLLAASGVERVDGAATVVEPGTLLTGEGKTLRARNTVIATGAASWIPPIPGADLPGVLTTRGILQLDKLPKSLVIVGGGIIGQEFATIFSTLGTRVTILEALGRILGEVDSELARKYASLLPARDITCEVGVSIHGIERSNDELRVVYEKKGKEKVVSADVVLMATGRRPVLDGWGREHLNAKVDNGALAVDEFLRTSIDGTYGIGDVIGKKMLAHVASYHGEIVAENCAGRNRTVHDDVIPSCIFTVPQISWVGLTEDEAKEAGRAFRTSTFSLSTSGKAQAIGEPRGWLKLVEDTTGGRLIGAHFMGPQVSELIAEMALAMRSGLGIQDIIETIHPHPTLSEAVREAALGLRDGPIHSESRVKEYGS